MADIDELYTKAKEKLDAENFQHGTPQDTIRSMCLEWLEWARTNDTKAVELLADAAKDTKGAYNAMENFARNKKGKVKGKVKVTCVKLEPLEAMACVMEYYGIDKNEAHNQLEAGLMYHLMMAECKKYRPYGADEQPKATPVTDLEKKPYEKTKLEEASPSFSFDDFDSELEGLL